MPDIREPFSIEVKLISCPNFLVLISIALAVMKDTALPE